MIKIAPKEIESVLNDFTEASFAKYGVYSHATASYQWLLAALLVDQPQNIQSSVLDTLRMRITELQE